VEDASVTSNRCESIGNNCIFNRRKAALMFDQVRDLFATHPLLGLVAVELIAGVSILALALLDSCKERRALRRSERECSELERLFSLQG
jgi:hypothetical protein